MTVVAGVLPRDRVGLREEDLFRVQRDELEIRPLPMMAMMVGGRAMEVSENRGCRLRSVRIIAWVQSKPWGCFAWVQFKSSPGFNPNRGVASLLLL